MDRTDRRAWGINADLRFVSSAQTCVIIADKKAERSFLENENMPVVPDPPFLDELAGEALPSNSLPIITDVNRGNLGKFRPLSLENRIHISTRRFELRITDDINHVKYHHADTPLTQGPFECFEVQGDGNCLFRALSYCMAGSVNHFAAVRTQICNYIKDPKNWNHLKSYIPFNDGNSYINASTMSKNGVWGTEKEIFAAAVKGNRDIFVFQNQYSRWEVARASGNSRNPTEMACYLELKDQHYRPIVGMHVHSKTKPGSTGTSDGRFREL